MFAVLYQPLLATGMFALIYKRIKIYRQIQNGQSHDLIREAIKEYVEQRKVKETTD